MIAPVRVAFRLPTTARLMALLALAAAAPAYAQQLTLPSDPLGDSQTPLISQGDSNTGSVASSGGVVIGEPAPSTLFSSGTLYNPATGSHIRAQYNTESYGQAEGNFNLGTMLLREYQGGYGFFDGQVTLNDESRVGYNLGVGYRWMTLPLLPNSPDDAKIMGVSFWADGQSVDGENFFPQIGTSLEFLGDRIDFRANGYAVVGDRTQSRDFVGTGDTVFSGNFLAEQTVGVLDTALTVAEAELAGRLADLDAWLFGGVYGFAGGGFDETGGKIGVRGYITPDLNLSVAITHDELFDTNGVMRLTWFIGRTRRENAPTGTLRDRFREPVIRNDYVAVVESSITGVQDIVTDADGENFRIVHVDSTAASGGDGSFENPLNSLDDIAANSMEGDTILAHGGSVFTGQGAVLQDSQSFLGEGGGIDNTITVSTGTLTLPETAAGAQAGAIPTINAAPTAGVVLADDNTVNNLAFDGGVRAITTDNSFVVAGGDSSANATLTNLQIANVAPAATEGAINLVNIDRADVDDLDNDGDTTEIISTLGTVTIDNITFSGTAGSDIVVDAGSTAATILSESVNISNVTSTGNTVADSLVVRNTNGVTTDDDVEVNNYDITGGFAGMRFETNANDVEVTNSSITGLTDVNGAAIAVADASGVTEISGSEVANVAGGGIVVQNNTADVNIGSATTNGEVTLTDVAGIALDIDGSTAAVTFDNSSSITGGGGPGINAVEITNTGDGGTVSIGATATITDVGGRAVFVENNLDTVTVDADITNAGASPGGGVEVVDNQAVVSFGGAITTQDTDAITITGAMDGVNFSGEITSNGTGDTITITNGNADADITFSESITNDAGGRLLVVDGGDENILFNTGTGTPTITDDGDGISITNRGSGGLVDFNVATTLNTGGDSVLLGAAVPGGGANADDSTVDFSDLTITNTGGAANGAIRGADVGVLNIATGSITTTGGADAANLVRGSSSTGIVLTSVDVSGGADNAIVLTDFDGTVTAGGGTLTTTGRAVEIDDSGLTLNGVSIDSATDQAIAASYSSGTTLGVTVNGSVSGSSNASFGDGDVEFSTTGDAGISALISNVDDIGDMSFAQGGSNTSVFALTSVTTSGGFDLDVTDDGDLSATFTTVTGSGNTTLDVSDDGNGSLVASGFETGGSIVANSTAGSDGNLTVSVANSGGTTAFTGLTVNDQGDGAVSADFNNVTSDSGVNFDSAGAGTASLEVNGGSYGGGIDADAANSDTFTAMVIGSPTLTTGGVDINATNGGQFDADVTGVDAAAGGLTIVANNTTGNATADVSSGTYGGNVSITSASAGTFDTDVTNVTATSGTLTVGLESTGNATADISGGDYGGDVTLTGGGTGTRSFTATNVTTTGGLDLSTLSSNTNATVSIVQGSYGGDLDLDLDNTATLNLTVSNVSITTGNDDVALAVAITNGASGDVIINDNATVVTNDNQALQFIVSNGDIDLALKNNGFTNNSQGSGTALVDLSGGGSVLNATILDNTFTNLDAARVATAPELLVTTSAGAPTLNLNIAGNTANLATAPDGDGILELREAAGVFSVFDLTDTELNTGGRNDPAVVFDPAVGDFDNLNVAPRDPSNP